VECSDETVFAQAQQGDRSAFGLLVQRYQDRAYSVARKILPQPHEARDATQQAFLYVWQKREDYNPRWRFCTWLYRIVTNVCIDEYRRQQRHQVVTETLLEAWPAPDCPAQVYEQAERCRVLRAALERVPVEARIVLVLCYMEGLSYAEIARVRGISVHTVKSQLRRAKALLRQHLAAYAEETP
jgi:RNA polymerase sigma-70 factor (ECF subfamily)